MKTTGDPIQLQAKHFKELNSSEGMAMVKQEWT